MTGSNGNLKFSGAPPLPPPKPEQHRSVKASSSSDAEEQDASIDSPPRVISPGSSAAVSFMKAQDERKQEATVSTFPQKSDSELKQDWRKSDATTMSYVTIRPNALSGSRSPRSLAKRLVADSGHDAGEAPSGQWRFPSLLRCMTDIFGSASSETRARCATAGST